jgi:CysZ protein
MNQKKPNVIARVLSGFLAPLRGLVFLFKHPGLMRFALFPILINIILVLSMYIFGSRFLVGLMDRWIPDEQAWYWAVLFWIAAVFIVLALLLVSAVLFYIVAGIICVPFNELLSQKVEEIMKGRPHDEVFSIRLLALDIWLAIVGEIKRVFLFLGLILPLLLLNLIPGIGTVAYGILAGVVTLLFLAYDFLDHPLGRRRLPFGEKRKFMLRNFPSTIGFGGGVFIFLLVPVINFVVLPINAIGATLLFTEIEGWSGEIEYRGLNRITKKRKEG